MKKFFALLRIIRKIFFPTKKELNLSEAKKLVKSLMAKHTIEEQSSIASMIIPELIIERKTEIEKYQTKITRLEKDLEFLQNHVSI